ncbi:recombinase family protein [Clostridium botulinum]|uniref:recombinase family protein n=1 Tax=Clostridium botulinum TaxID=1491 RepID=UPI0007748A42|nr:recombinase family protein [Clostridium botulinum]NFL39294.1 recombinase family protein [Clostridium botulinum]NFL65828.1 recombinase family protein [Clostridium botulinum]
MIFGYMRISTNKEKQKTDRQEITLINYSKENSFKFDDIIPEKISGSVKANHRPKYKSLKEKLRSNDILIITDVDRLGRDADDIIMEFKNLKAIGIRIIPLDVPYLNQWKNAKDDSMYNMISDIYITIKAHQAQQEKEKIVARINQGLDAAKAKGTKLGRPPVKIDPNFIREYTKFKNGIYGDITATNFAKMLGIGRSTLYKYIKILKNQE